MGNIPVTPNKLTMNTARPFIGAKDFDASRDFYVALGFTLHFEVEQLADMQFGDFRFYLQRYYQQDWCENSMVHITVDDAHGWYEHVSAVLAANTFGSAKVSAPARQDYGALVTFVWDPGGVLLHLAQFD